MAGIGSAGTGGPAGADWGAPACGVASGRGSGGGSAGRGGENGAAAVVVVPAVGRPVRLAAAMRAKVCS
jgi:hypothetical protein